MSGSTSSSSVDATTSSNGLEGGAGRRELHHVPPSVVKSDKVQLPLTLKTCVLTFS